MVISDKLYRIITKEGFETEFWKDLMQCRSEERECTRRAVYERLEELFEKEFHARQYPSFEAFSKRINRKVRKVR